MIYTYISWFYSYIFVTSVTTLIGVSFMSTMIAVRLPEDIETRLDKLARRTGRTKTYYVREAILNHIDDLEDIYLAEQSLANIESGKSKTTPLTEVLKRHGLAG